MNPRRSPRRAVLLTVSSRALLVTVTVAAAVSASGCKSEPELRSRDDAPRPSVSSVSSVSAGSSGKGSLPPDALLAPPVHPAQGREVLPLTWADPPGWTRAPSNAPMRLATYRVPRATGDTEDGEMTVFHFGAGQGGGVDANFDRWVSQFQGVDRSKAVRSERSAQGMNEHVLEIESGSFVAMARPGEAPGGSKENYGLLGAIVDTPGGAYFFKLVGPKKTLKAARAAFFVLLDSVKQPSPG